MSLGRCIKLIHMMGLHRLDDPNAELEMAPTIAPPKDWTELEGLYKLAIHYSPHTFISPYTCFSLFADDPHTSIERRRVFWGAFAMESHASVNTGWPFLIQLDEVGLPFSPENEYWVLAKHNDRSLPTYPVPKKPSTSAGKRRRVDLKMFSLVHIIPHLPVL